ncbi:MAG: hypothetical protein ABFS46_19990 [Myxococcota bacterium]
MKGEPQIRIVGDRVVVEQGRRRIHETPLSDVVAAIARAAERPGKPRVLPRGVRLVRERRDAVALAVEIPPRARTVRWLAGDSGKPFGRGASYREYFLSFPYVVLLIVLRRGELTGLQQLYYRVEGLDAGEELLLPNLYNVAEGYGQRCWLCLQNLGSVAELPWPGKVERISEHLFSAAFNQSAENHEGNSYWSSANAVDTRVKTPEAWDAASRENPWFALEVPWRPAKTTASAELEGMLDRVVAPLALSTSMDLAGLITGARQPRAGRRR